MISCEEYSKVIKKIIKGAIWKDKTDISLGIIQAGDNPVSNKYVKMKMKDCEEVGIKAYLYKEKSFDFEKFLELVKDVSEKHTGIIIQLPLPEKINEVDMQRIIQMIPKKHDIDGFRRDSLFTSCTAVGIVDYLHYNNIDLKGKNAVVIGRSDIVGKPMAKELLKEDCTVTVCHSKTEGLSFYTKNADLIIVAAGKRNLLKSDMVSEIKKPIVIDVGINIDENGKLHGDCDYDGLKDKCYFITPVPKGVGLLTRIGVLNNLIKAYFLQSVSTDI